jgi:hypothetical protein
MANLSNLLSAQSNLVTDQDLAAVATSGNYADLTNKPVIPSGSYADLTNKPTLATVATSGSYTDLINKPTVISLKGTSVTYPGDDLAVDIAGLQTITITGTGFEATPTVYIGGTIAPSVTFVTSTQITVTTPAKAAGTYDIYIVNPGGATAIMVFGISYSGTPAWTTPAGNLGAVDGSFTIQLQAAGDAVVSYALASGSTLPSGVTLSSTGLITGNAVGTEQTFNFTVNAIDGQNQDTPRSFSVSVVLGDPLFKYVTLLLTGDGVTAANNNTILDSSGIATSTAAPTQVLDPSIAVNGWFTRTGSATSTYSSSRELIVRANGVTIFSSTSNFPASVVYNGVTYSPGSHVDSAFGWSGDFINRFSVSASSAVFTPSITTNGNVTQGTFSPYGSNWSNYFDGNRDYLVTPSSSGFAFGTGNFTIEHWVFAGTQPESFPRTIVIGPTYDTNSVGTTFDDDDFPGKICFYARNLLNGRLLVSTTNVNDNKWHHIAITRASGVFRLFVNGVLEATNNSYINGDVGGFGQTCSIGGPVSELSGEDFQGHISNVRIVQGTALYTSNFTPSTAPLTAVSGTSLLTCQSNRFRDNSTNNFTITSSGTPRVQRFSPFTALNGYNAATIGGSAYFDGSGDYFTAPSNSAFNFGSGDYTVEGWVNVSNTTFSLYATGGSGSIDQFVVDGGLLYWGYQDGTPLTNGINFFTSNDLNQWIHVAVARSGTAQRYFKNGVLVSTITTNASYGSSTNVPHIGRRSDGGYQTVGYISNLRVVKGTAVYTANFTPPTTPVTAIANTSLLCNFTNAAIFDSAMMNDLETVGNAQISTSVVKYGTGSMVFDGNGDYLTSASSPNFAFGTGDFTVEAWIYANALNGERGFIQTSATVGGLQTSYTNGIAIFANGPGNGLIAQVGGLTLNSGNAITTNAWYHVALTRNSGSCRMFINGVLFAGPTTNASNLTGTNVCIGGYYSPSFLWNGYIDDLRITNGIARYTANFTPPSLALKTK